MTALDYIGIAFAVIVIGGSFAVVAYALFRKDDDE